MICAVAATASPSTSRNAGSSTRTGTPRAPARRPGRPRRRGAAARRRRRRAASPTATPKSVSTWSRGDAEERPEEHRLQALEHAVVEAEEQEAEREARHLHGADDGRLLRAVAAFRPRSRAMTSAPRPRSAEVPGGERDAGERRAARARERHHRERVAGKALPAEHHEPPDHRGRERRRSSPPRARCTMNGYATAGGSPRRVQGEVRVQPCSCRCVVGGRLGRARRRRAARRTCAAPRSARRRGRSASRCVITSSGVPLTTRPPAT